MIRDAGKFMVEFVAFCLWVATVGICTVLFWTVWFGPPL